MKPVLLITGLGQLAYETLRILIGRLNVKIVVVSRPSELATQRFNHLILTNSHLGLFRNLTFVPCDLHDTEALASILFKTNPSVVFHTACTRTWWKNVPLVGYNGFPLKDLGTGIFYPFHATLALRTMAAVRQSGVRAKVVNACYPDAVNPALSRIGEAPYIGVGNISNAVPAIKFAIAEHFNLPPKDVALRVAGHHAAGYSISRRGHTNGAPLFLKASVNGFDLPVQEELDEILLRSFYRFKRLTGVEGQSMTAHSAASVLLTLFGEKISNLHAPGICGWEGGYPILPDLSGVNCLDQAELDEMRTVNVEGQRFDGIESIDSSGTVVLTNQCSTAMHATLGVSFSRYKISDVPFVAEELNHLLVQLERKIAA